MIWMIELLKSEDLGGESLTESLILLDIFLCQLAIGDTEDYIKTIVEINSLLSSRREEWGEYPKQLFDKKTLEDNLPGIALAKLDSYREARLNVYESKEPALYNYYIERVKEANSNEGSTKV